jgi:hypothetical protein
VAADIFPGAELFSAGHKGMNGMGRKHSPRVKAAAMGERFYQGQICATCGGTQRYTSGGTCVGCQKTHNRNGGMSAGNPGERPDPAAVAARNARAAYVESFEMRWLGDPPPGRSALERKRASP